MGAGSVPSRLAYGDRRCRGAAGWGRADVLVFPVYYPVTLTEAAEGLDRLLDGRLARLIEEGEIRWKRGSVALTHTDGRLGARRVGGAGVGKDALDPDSLRTAAAAVTRRTKEVGGSRSRGSSKARAASRPPTRPRAIVEAPSRPVRERPVEDERRRRRRRPRAPRPLRRRCRADEAARASLIASWANRCRDLVNAPANELTPSASPSGPRKPRPPTLRSASRRWARRRSAPRGWAPSRP